MLKQLKEKDYKNILFRFEQICGIPHGSYDTSKLADFLIEFAKERGLVNYRDEAGNVIIKKPAAKGYENVPAVILQGHMDMVCEKDSNASIDFTNDGLQLQTDGEWLFANGTTLGGDDGIALAYMLALLEDAEAKHPALECVITTEEEVGMDGALALDCTVLSAKRMINLDSEEDDCVLCGCAGGTRVRSCLPLRWQQISGTAVKISVSGLLGGHSGTEIDKNRTNATLLLGKILFMLSSRKEFFLSDLYGGNKDNAIPREATAEIVVLPEQADSVISELEKIADTLKKTLSTTEPTLTVTISSESTGECAVLHPMCSERILFLLVQTPNGVQNMSGDIEGLVETSLNLGIFEVTQSEAVFDYSLRSNKASELKYLQERLVYLHEFLGCETETTEGYPGWEYRKNSELRDLFCEKYERMYQRQPIVSVIHAGVECGIFCEKIPDLDVISIGPRICDIHTPKERLSIPSAIQTYRLLEQMLADLK